MAKQDDYLPNDPHKGVPLADLIKKHGGFTSVVEQKDWFDSSAKPKRKKSESEFEPDPTIEDAPDGNI